MNVKIYIPENVPSGNKGEEAILRGIKDGLHAIGVSGDIWVYSDTPEIDEANYRKNFRVVRGVTFRASRSLASWRRIATVLVAWAGHLAFMVLWPIGGRKCLSFFRGENWRAYVESDVILVGHDGMFSELNLLFAVFVKAIGKRSVVFGCGFKRLRWRISEIVAKRVLAKMDLLVVREKRTRDYLLKIGLQRGKVLLRPDPAFLMQPEQAEIADQVLRDHGLTNRKEPIIGAIAVIGHSYYNHFYGCPNDLEERYRRHIDFFAGMVRTIYEITSGTIVFLPHSIQGELARDDRVVARDVKRKLGRHGGCVTLIEGEYDAAVLKSLIGQFDFLVSQRLHAVIAATGMATPFLMVTVREDERAIDIVSNTIGREDLIFEINAPEIIDFADRFRKHWAQRRETAQYLMRRRNGIEKECENGVKLLAEVMRSETE